MEDLKINIDGKEHNVKVEKLNNKLKVYLNGDVYVVETKQKQQSYDIEESEAESGKGIVTAPIPGIIFSIDVKVGEKVKKGKRLMTLMAMKMENEIIAPVKGKIREIRVKKNQSINKGDILAVIE